MQLRIGILCLLGFAAKASAAPTWVDGPASNIVSVCGADASYRNIVTKAGYVTDPIVEAPQLGQVVYVHGVATNTNCAPEAVAIEFILPQGASFAVSAQNPVVCNMYKNAQRFDAPVCQQTPLQGLHGGKAFADIQFIVPKNSTDEWTLEVSVPVVFTQAIADTPITVVTSKTLDDWAASTVNASVPFQPALPAYQNGDDLVLLGSSGADEGMLPVAFSAGNGAFAVTNYPVGDFAALARTPNVTRLTGDFNRDGYADYALVGGAGWRTIPVAMSQGNGRFTFTNTWVGDFGAWAATPGVKALAGDFNRDGHTDIALVGGPGWNTLPIAFSAHGGGNGAFEITNNFIGSFAQWATVSGARPIVGDYNRDGMSDIALVGGSGWATIPVAYSYGNGSFQVFNPSSTGTGSIGYYPYSWNFAAAANETGAQLLATDFNKDGMTDLLIVGGNAQGIRFAMSYGNGTWQIFERQDAALKTFANTAGAKVLVGDFNKDGWPDLAVTGASGWNFLPIATNAGGNGFWSTTTRYVGDFGAWAATPGVKQIVGDFNGDGWSDIALTGGNGWGSIPVAMNNGNGFAISNAAVNRFPRWSAQTTSSVFAGRVNY
jgi:hypothetical protein